jgi:hypothetical protein
VPTLGMLKTLIEAMAAVDPSLLDKPVTLEGCDCVNDWAGGIDPTGESATLLIERPEPTTTMEVKVDPRVEELRKRGILPP